MSRCDFVTTGRLFVLALTSFIATDAMGKLPVLAQGQGQAQAQGSSSTTASSAPATKPGDKGKSAEKKDPAAAQPATDEFSVYKIGIEDELQINVWHEPELTMGVQVRPDGMITMPLINDVSVIGMTTKELQAALTEKLSAYVNEPQVTVIVKSIKSRKVFVVGQVAKPGPYPLVGRKTVLEVILEAGGLGPFAKAGSINVVRTVKGQQVRMKFNYKKALSGKGGGEDIELLPGDMIVVP